MKLRRCMLFGWILALAAVLTPAVWADEPVAVEQPLTLDEAIRRALLVSPDILLAKFDVLEAEIALKEAEINQLAGRPVSELEEAKRSLVEARAAFVEAISEVALQVQEAYYEVIRTGVLNELQQKTNEQTERQLAVAMTRYEAGLISEHEIDEITLQSDQAALENAAALERYEDANRELAILVGADEWVAIDPSNLDLTFQPLDITLSQALTEALATRREIGNGAAVG